MHHDAEGLGLIEADIRRQPDVLGESVPRLRDTAAGVANSLPPSRSRVFLVGCGDSLDAGMVARYVWERLLGVPVEPVPAMTFATSVVQLSPKDALVVALSQSGRVSRVLEAIRAARARGLPTVTITANGASPLATEPSDATWVLAFDKLGVIPGTASYLLGIAALYELGCALARPGPPVDRLRWDVDQIGSIVSRAIEASESAAERHAEAMVRNLPLLALGYGPTLSSARFTVRKILELAQLVAISQETEEYAHDEYSLVDERFRVLQMAPPGRGACRSEEVAGYLKRLGVHLGVVTDGPDGERYRDVADVLYQLPPTPETLVPLTYAVPGQLLSVAVARRVGGSLYGMAERVHREDSDPQIYESEILA